jgi:hypothetical protein
MRKIKEKMKISKKKIIRKEMGKKEKKGKDIL